MCVYVYIYIERERTELIVYELKKLSLFYALKEKKTFENKMVGRQSALKNNKKKVLPVLTFSTQSFFKPRIDSAIVT